MALLRNPLTSKVGLFLLLLLIETGISTGSMGRTHNGATSHDESSLSRLDPLARSPSAAVSDGQPVTAFVDIPGAYAALPSTGGVITLQNDITISAPQTLQMAIGKSLKLDFAGHTVTCANPSNNTICLTISKPDSNPRYRLEIAGSSGTLTFSGSATAITGLKIQGVDSSHGASDFSLHDVHFAGFGTSSSVALDLGAAEEAEIYSNTFTENALGMTAGLNFNNNYLHGNSFHHNTGAFIFTDIMGVKFDSNMIQSNSGTKPAQFVSQTLGLDTLIFTNNWFENNGDGTGNSRALFFNIGPGTRMTRMQLLGNTFGGGPNTPTSSAYVEKVGAGAATMSTIQGNHWYLEASGPAIQTGFVFGLATTCINETWNTCDLVLSPEGYLGNASHTGSRVRVSGTLRSDLFSTTTNCSGVGTAANPSVVSCGSAAAGSIVCATSASGGTCRVDTTAMTANSQLFVMEDATLGSKLGVSCNTSPAAVPVSQLIAARSPGVGFTINLGRVINHPACFSYFIIN